MQKRVPPEFEDFADQIGLVVQHWGFKKIHGQVWTHIYLAKQPIDASTLVRRLGVSKALISLVIKDLIRHDAVQVAGQGQRRKILLQANRDLTTVITKILRWRERRMISQVGASQNVLAKLSKQEDAIEWDRDQLEVLGQLIKSAETTLETLINSGLKF